MLSGRVARVAAGVIVALILAGSSLPLSAVDPPAEETSEVVAIRGRVVCVDSVPTATVSPESDPCNQPGVRFELHSVGGEVVRFVAADPRSDIFTDPQVRNREVEVRGWRRTGEAIEILSVYAVKDGALHHLHYRCDVCNITTYAPGPCWCCGAPFELREGPAGGEQPDPG